MKSGALAERVKTTRYLLRNCRNCPRDCGTDRTKNFGGYCRSGLLPIVSSYSPHFGEEPYISGTNGAGNIFFGNCNLRCIFCQNFEISQNWREEKKHEVSAERLAEIMLELQRKKCHNIGLVSPTHFSVQILEAVHSAALKGLNIPLVYNSNGYDSVEMLKYFDGVVDIYLPDFKYGNDEYGMKYSDAVNYFENACMAIREMYRQVGDDLVIENGVVVKGLIIRHLVLPNGLAESEKIFEFISSELSRDIYISLMSQYFPSHKSHNDILIDRTIRSSEYEKTLELMEKYGLHNGWIQELESSKHYRPDFISSRDVPFRSE